MGGGDSGGGGGEGGGYLAPLRRLQARSVRRSASARRRPAAPARSAPLRRSRRLRAVRCIWSVRHSAARDGAGRCRTGRRRAGQGGGAPARKRQFPSLQSAAPSAAASASIAVCRAYSAAARAKRPRVRSAAARAARARQRAASSAHAASSSASAASSRATAAGSSASSGVAFASVSSVAPAPPASERLAHDSSPAFRPLRCVPASSGPPAPSMPIKTSTTLRWSTAGGAPRARPTGTSLLRCSARIRRVARSGRAARHTGSLRFFDQRCVFDHTPLWSLYA